VISLAEPSTTRIGPGVLRTAVLATIALLLAGARPVRRESISLEIAQPPPEQVNSQDLWNITLRNPAPDTKSVVLQVEARGSKAGAVFSARTQEIAVPPGERRLSAPDITLSDVWLKKGYEAFAAAGALLPEGDYTYVVTTTAAMKQVVLFLRVRVPKPVELVWPPNGIVVGDSQPLFAWRPPVMSGPKVDHRYVVSVAEVARGQTAAAALSSNRPVFEIRGVRATAYRAFAKAAAFEPGRTYAWSVGVADSSGVSTDSVRTQSRASSFVFKPGANQAEVHTSFRYPRTGRAVTGVTSLVVESDVPDAELCVLEYSLGSDSTRGEWQVAGCFPKAKNSFVGMWGSDSAVIRAGRTFPSPCLLRATVLGRPGKSGEALLPVTINPPPAPTRKGCGGCNQHPDE
jgi:hypothetical protein